MEKAGWHKCGPGCLPLAVGVPLPPTSLYSTPLLAEGPPDSKWASGLEKRIVAPYSFLTMEKFMSDIHKAHHGSGLLLTLSCSEEL